MTLVKVDVNYNLTVTIKLLPQTAFGRLSSKQGSLYCEYVFSFTNYYLYVLFNKLNINIRPYYLTNIINQPYWLRLLAKGRWPSERDGNGTVGLVYAQFFSNCLSGQFPTTQSTITTNFPPSPVLYFLHPFCPQKLYRYFYRKFLKI